MSIQSVVLANIILRCLSRLDKLIPGNMEGGFLISEELEAIKDCTDSIKDDNKKQA